LKGADNMDKQKETPETQMSPTNKILTQILDVSTQSLEVSKQTLAAEQASAASLSNIENLLSNFTHNYTVQVEQILLTKPITRR
jgi:hypothetical protein